MIKFWPEQEEIFNYKEEIMAVPSVPGSGKTFTLTHLPLKLSKEIDENSKILILTYMNSAVENFYERLKTLDKNVSNIEVKTIHKFCLDLIKENIDLFNISEDFALLDRESSRKLVEDLYKTWFNENKEKLKTFYKIYSLENEEDFYQSLKFCLLNFISRSKNFAIEVDKIKENTGEDLVSLAVDFYEKYQIFLKQNKYLDSDDILLKSYKLIVEGSGVDKNYKFILEDESQDSNFLQSKIVQLINNQNLVKVGDSNQNITGSFTNSSPKIFKKFIKEANIIKELRNNNRSSEKIIFLSNLFIKYTKLYHPTKEARSALSSPFIKSDLDKYPDSKIINYLKKDINEEFNLCIQKIKNFSQKFPEKNIGILAPRNKHLNILANLLRKENLDFEILSDFSQNNLETYQKLSDFLEFIDNPNNKKIFIKILEKHLLKSELSSENKEYIIKSDMKNIFFNEKINELNNHIYKLKLLLDFSINTKEKTLIYISQNFDFDNIEQEIIEIISLNLKTIFKLNPKWSYKNLVYELRKVENNRINYFNWGLSKKSHRNKKITLCTYHKSKGREWDFVYMLCLNEEFFPVFLHKEQQGEKNYLKDEYRIPEALCYYELEKLLKGDFHKDYINSYKADKISESLRIIYVGITRAKEFLVISSNLENEGVFYYKLFKKLISKIEKLNIQTLDYAPKPRKRDV